MKEKTNVRIYGRLLREWRTDYRVEQLEYEYTDYTEDGRVVGRGTEDFSLERWNKQTRLFWVWTWDGVKRNAGGKRWFCPERVVRIRNVRGERGRVLEVLKRTNVYCAMASEVQLRG